jgi:hypothetical protein
VRQPAWISPSREVELQDRKPFEAIKCLPGLGVHRPQEGREPRIRGVVPAQGAQFVVTRKRPIEVLHDGAQIEEVLEFHDDEGLAGMAHQM